MSSDEYKEITNILELLRELEFSGRLGNVNKEPWVQTVWEDWEKGEVSPFFIPFIQAVLPKFDTSNLSFQAGILSDGSHEVIMKKDNAGILAVYKVLAPVRGEERERLENQLAELLEGFVKSKLSEIPQRDKEDLAQDILIDFLEKVREKKIEYPERWHSFLKAMIHRKKCEYFREKKKREMSSLTEECLEKNTALKASNRASITEEKAWQLLQHSQEENLFSKKEKNFDSLLLDKAQERKLSAWVVLSPLDETWPEILKKEAGSFQEIFQEVANELGITKTYAVTLLSRVRQKWRIFVRDNLE